MAGRHEKGKALEKDTGKFLLENNGSCPKWGGLTTETGRTGQLSDLQMDVLSKTYAVECKNGTHVPTTPFKWLEQIDEVAEKHQKTPLLVLQVDGRSFRRQNVMHCLTPERHAELLEYERKSLDE